MAKRKGMTMRIHDWKYATLVLDHSARAGMYFPRITLHIKGYRITCSKQTHLVIVRTFNWNVPHIGWQLAYRYRRYGMLQAYKANYWLVRKVSNA